MATLNAALDLPLGEHAPRAARRALHAVLESWGFTDREWRSGAAIVVSELVTNAVVHGGGCVELRVEAHERQVRISVADGSAVIPRRRDPDRRGGRGLALIEAVADRWWIEEHDGGKRVWAELPAPR